MAQTEINHAHFEKNFALILKVVTNYFGLRGLTKFSTDRFWPKAAGEKGIAEEG